MTEPKKRSRILDAIGGVDQQKEPVTMAGQTMGQAAEIEGRAREAGKLGGPDFLTAVRSSLAWSDRGRLDMMERKYPGMVTPVFDRRTGKLRNVLYRTGPNEPERILNPENEINTEDMLAIPWSILKSAPAVVGGALGGPVGAIAGDVAAEGLGQAVSQIAAPEDVPISERAASAGVTLGAGLLGEAVGAGAKALVRKLSPAERFAARVRAERVASVPVGTTEFEAAAQKAAGKTRSAQEVAKETITPEGKRIPKTEDVFTAGQASRSTIALDKETMLRRTERFGPQITPLDQRRLAYLTSSVYDTIKKLAGEGGVTAVNRRSSSELSTKAANATEQISKTLRNARNKAWKEGMAHVQSLTGDFKGYPMREVDASLASLGEKVAKGRASQTEELVYKKLEGLFDDYKQMHGTKHASIGNISGDLMTLTDWIGSRGSSVGAPDLTQEQAIYKNFKSAIMKDLDAIENETDAPLRTEAATALKAVRGKYAQDSAEIEDFMGSLGDEILGLKGKQKTETIADEILKGKYGDARVEAYFKHLDRHNPEAANALRAGVLVEMTKAAKPSASAALSAAGTEGESAAGMLSRFIRDNEGRLRSVFPENKEAWLSIQRVGRLADSMSARGVSLQPQGSQTGPFAEFIKASIGRLKNLPGIGKAIEQSNAVLTGIPSDAKLYEMLFSREGRDIMFGLIDPPKGKVASSAARSIYRMIEYLGRDQVEPARKATPEDIARFQAQARQEDIQSFGKPRGAAKFSDIIRQMTPEEAP